MSIAQQVLLRERFRIRTGIGVLDHILVKLKRETKGGITGIGGETGIPTKSINLLEAPIDMEEFIFTIVRNYVREYEEPNRKGPIIIVSAEEKEEILREVIASKANWESLRGAISYINTAPSRGQTREEAEREQIERNLEFNKFMKFVRIVDASNLNEIGDSTGIVNWVMRARDAAISEGGGEVADNGGIVIFYTLSKLALFWRSWEDPSEVIKLINKLTYEADRFNFAVLLGVDPGMHSREFVNMLERLSDIVVKIQVDTSRGIPERFILAESKKAQLARRNECFPYVLIPRKGIFRPEELITRYMYSSVSKIYELAGERTQKEIMEGARSKDFILTGVFPIDYDPSAVELSKEKRIEEGLKGIPTEQSYAFYYVNYTDLYPFVLSIIDTILRYSNQSIYMFFIEDSVVGFYNYMKSAIRNKEIYDRLMSSIGRRMFFLDATETDYRVIEREIMRYNRNYRTEREELRSIKEIEDPENLSETIFYIERFIKFKDEKKYLGLKGPVVLFLTFSALASRVGFDRSFKAVAHLVSKYTWTSGKEVTFMLFTNPRALKEDELNKVKSLVGGEIVLDSREVYGHTVNYIRVLRLPERESYLSEWIPYIPFNRYPPGVIYNKVEFTELAIARRIIKGEEGA